MKSGTIGGVNLTRIRLLLVAWWCATVLPGVGMALLFPDEIESGSGSVVGVWIGGFVLQLFLFMAVSKQLKGVGTMMAIWFVVSLLPFAIDWTPAASWWGTVAFVLLAVVIALYVDYVLTRHALLQHNGVRATAVVLEVKKPLMNVVVNNIYIKRKLRVRVERDDHAPPYETTYSDLWEIGTVPDPGDSFRVVLDAKRPQHLSALDDQSSPAPTPNPGGRASSGRSSWRFTSWRNPAPAKPSATYPPYSPQPAPSPEASATSAASVPGVVAAIRELAALHESGQLTDDEFAQAKRELLGGQDSAPQE